LSPVIVKGQFVKRDNQATDVMAGEPILYPVEDNGRQVPASTKQRPEDFSLDDSSVRPRTK
jgi:hypothetical protein